jgi:hypothetical protein
MGAQQSNATFDNLNERITNIATSNVVNCNTMVAQNTDQVVNVGGWFSSGTDISTAQEARLNIDCATDSKSMTALQNQIINEIAGSNTASGVSVLPAFGNTSTNQIAKITNIVRTSITKKNIVNNYVKISQDQSQKVNISTLFQFGTTVRAKQDAEIFAKSVVKALDDNQELTAIKNQSQLQGSATSANPLDFITKTVSAFFGGVSSLWGTILGGPATFILMIVFVVFAVVLWKSGSLAKVSEGVSKKIAGP